jgi:hypothetical protein
MASLRRTLGRCLDLTFLIIVVAAVVSFTVGAATAGRGAYRFLEAHTDPPRARMGPVRCHWHGRWLIARGPVVNVSDRDATFVVAPQIAIMGIGRHARETDAVHVRGYAAAEWRWTDGATGVPSGSPVTRCSATVSFRSREGGD